MIRQLSILGNRRTRVNFRSRAVAIPTTTPIIRLPKKIRKKMPTASNRLTMVADPPLGPSGLYLCAVSKMTIAIASLRMDSPNMIVYSFGSTLYVLKMARIVTGSVAESVAPTDIASTKDIWNRSSGIRVHTHKNKPKTTADIKVPAKANVRIVPIFRKKFAYQSHQHRLDSAALCGTLT